MVINLTHGKFIEENGKQFYVIPHSNVKIPIEVNMTEVDKSLKKKTFKVTQKRKKKNN